MRFAKLMAGVLSLCVSAALVSCGSDPAHGAAVTATDRPNASPAPSSTASASAAPTTAYVAIEVGSGTASAVHIVDLTGKLVAAAGLAAFPTVSVAGVGSHGVYIAGPGHKLGRLELDGKVHPLDATPAGDAGEMVGLAESPDGTQWAYSLVSFANDTNLTATTRVYVASSGSPTRQVAVLKRPELSSASSSERYGGGYSVLRWDPAGLLLGSHPTGVGGVGPFISEGYGLNNVVRMDPNSGQASGRISPSGCRFGDIASDGTVACVSDSGITVTGAAGSATAPVPGLQSDHPAANLAFVGGSDRLIYSVATFSDASQPAWTDALMVATRSGGHLSSTTVARSLSSRSENGHTWSHVVDANTVAVIAGAADNSKLALLTIASGTMVTLGAADAIDGVFHAAS